MGNFRWTASLIAALCVVGIAAAGYLYTRRGGDKTESVAQPQKAVTAENEQKNDQITSEKVNRKDLSAAGSPTETSPVAQSPESKPETTEQRPVVTSEKSVIEQSQNNSGIIDRPARKTRTREDESYSQLAANIETLVADTYAEAKPSQKTEVYSDQFTEKESSEEKSNTSSKSSNTSWSDTQWNISALYGFKHLSLSQTNTLGNATVGVLMPGSVGLRSEFLYNNWSAWFAYDSNDLKYESASSSGQTALNSLRFGGSWKKYWIGLDIDEFPLFKNNNGIVNLIKEPVMSLTVGTKHKWNLATITPTSINLVTRLSYPLSVSTDQVDVEASEVSGFGLGVTIELRRQLSTWEDKKLFILWPIGVEYYSFSQNVNWTPSQGEVNSSLMFISTALGIQLEF